MAWSGKCWPAPPRPRPPPGASWRRSAFPPTGRAESRPILVLRCLMHRDWTSQAASAAEVVGRIRSGMTVFLHGAAATPAPLVKALAARTDLERVRIVHLHIEGEAPYVAPGRESAFRAVSLFTSAPLRQAVAEGRA